FIGHIRNADALVMVLRTFANENVPPINGSVNPMRDLESLDAELILTDLTSVERRIERTTRAAKSGEKKYQQELQTLRRLESAISEFQPASNVELEQQERGVLSELFLLTMKPRMYVLNVSEDVLGDSNELLEKIRVGQTVAPDSLDGELKGIALV